MPRERGNKQTTYICLVIQKGRKVYLSFWAIWLIHGLLHHALQSAGTKCNFSSKHLNLLNKKVHLIWHCYPSLEINIESSHIHTLTSNKINQCKYKLPIKQTIKTSRYHINPRNSILPHQHHLKKLLFIMRKNPWKIDKGPKISWFDKW